MKTSPKRYENVDWVRVRKVLVYRAVQLTRAWSQVVDGTTPEYLADQVIMEFLLHPSGMDWDPKMGRLETFLRKILDYRWMDHWRRQSGVEQSVDDDEVAREPVGRVINHLVELEDHEFFETIRRRLQDEPDLVELIDAVEILDGDYHVVNQEAAKLIGTTVKDVENRKKRVRRALSGLPI